MPVAMEKALERVADKRGLTGKERDAFIYGTMRKTGWKPKQEVDKKEKREFTAMKTPTRLSRLIQLNAKTSRLMEFRYNEDEDGHPLAKTIGTAAAGAGALAGAQKLYKIGQAATGNFPGAGGEYGGMAQGTVGRIASNVMAGGKKVAGQAGGKIESLLQKFKGVRLSSRENLVRLNAVLDEVIEFAPLTAEQQKRQYEATGQKPENNFRRGAGLGLLSNGPVGGIIGAMDASKFSKEGVVYRKRDALGNALGGGLFGGAAAAGVGAALSRTKLGVGAQLATRTAAGIATAYAGQRGLANRSLKKSKARFALSALLDRAIEFESPLGTFQRTQQENLKKAQEKIHRESYVRRGAAIGAGTGAVTGGTLGAGIGMRAGGKEGAAIGAAVGTFYGGLGGLVGGVQIGGRIRRKVPLPATSTK